MAIGNYMSGNKQILIIGEVVNKDFLDFVSHSAICPLSFESCRIITNSDSIVSLRLWLFCLFFLLKF